MCFCTPGEKFDCAIHACSQCGVAINRSINFCGGWRPAFAEPCASRKAAGPLPRTAVGHIPLKQVRRGGAAAAGRERETEASASAAAADRKKIFPVSLIELAYLDRLVSILILAGLFSFWPGGVLSKPGLESLCGPAALGGSPLLAMTCSERICPPGLMAEAG